MFCPTPTTTRLMAIPDGSRGTLETLKMMRAQVRIGKISLPIRELALSLVGHLPQKDYVNQVKIIHAFVRDKIRYIKDITGVETLHSAVKVLEYGQGDCDDKAILVCALLESIGHPTRLVAVGFKIAQYSHVYAETKIGTKWVAIECTEPVSIGWSPSGVVAKMIVYN